MSRKAKSSIPLPAGVEVKLQGSELTVKGPKGSLTQTLMKGIVVDIQKEEMTVSLDSASGTEIQFLGLFWSLINNMAQGVKEGFVKRLEMIGVGFRAAVQGKQLNLQIGFSHPTNLPIPPGVEISIEKSTLIEVKGADKQLVGQFAADIRAMRPPEPYKGKGIRYEGEYVRRKAGKKSKK